MTDGPSSYPPPGAPPPADPPAGMPGATPPPPGAPLPAFPGPAPVPGAAGRPGAPTGAQPAPGGWAAYPAHGRGPAGNGPVNGLALGASHKPGAFPLRPLTLGAIYDGAFRIIRFNPRATVGAAVLVTAAAMLIPVLVTAVLTFTVGLAVDASGEAADDLDTAELISLLAAYGSLLLSIVLAQVGVVLVTGMVAHVARAAAVGRRMDLSTAWAATHGKRWRLIGLTVLVLIGFTVLLTAYVALWVAVVALSGDPWVILAWGLLSVPAFLCLCCWLWVRATYLAVPPLMLEDVGVLGALGRAWRLSGGHFWRTFGIGLLTIVIGGVAGSMLSTPISLAGQVGAFALPQYALLLLVLTQALALVVQNAFVAPFAAAVTSLQYVDLRMRKEALDVELLREAGLLAG